ncbi:Uncharacterized protein TCM_021389 [Theobroma cacao]|uniref:Uncharacterized protein n=1 Tax=Theobroma cacao TaxID=3641 RepID=A0A061EQX5_THECC|nr:Uncharacterized protein TCM_021389 [Theobroma cacao]
MCLNVFVVSDMLRHENFRVLTCQTRLDTKHIKIKPKTCLTCVFSNRVNILCSKLPSLMPSGPKNNPTTEPSLCQSNPSHPVNLGLPSSEVEAEASTLNLSSLILGFVHSTPPLESIASLLLPHFQGSTHHPISSTISFPSQALKVRSILLPMSCH